MSRQPSFVVVLILTLLVAVTACVAPTAQPATSSVADIGEKSTTATAVAPTAGSQDGPTPPVLAAAGQSGAANADVEFVRAIRGVDGTWTFHVTVAHPDTGWEDYADGWDVVLPDGTVVKPNPGSPFTRLLTHPHETEQPFTRSQGNLVIPENVNQVRVRAHDLVDGWGGKEVIVDLTAASGPGFEVESTE